MRATLELNGLKHVGTQNLWVHKHVVLSTKARRHIKTVANCPRNQVYKALRHVKADGT